MKQCKVNDGWIYWNNIRREADEMHREYKELQREPCSKELSDKLKLKDSIKLE